MQQQNEYYLEQKLEYEASLAAVDVEPTQEELDELFTYFERIQAENASLDLDGFFAQGGAF